MKKFLGIAFSCLIILLGCYVFVSGDGIADYSQLFQPFTTTISSAGAVAATQVPTLIKAANKARVYIELRKSGKIGNLTYIGNNVSISTYSATSPNGTFKLHPYVEDSSSTTLKLRNFQGALYGISVGTSSVTGYELLQSQ